MACAVLMACAATPSQAQERVHVGDVVSIETCTYFQNREGESAAVLTPWFAGFVSKWRSWWVKDCNDEFATLRASVTAALASSQKLIVGNGGYRVDLSLSHLNEGGAAPPTRPVGSGGYAVSRSWASVGLDVTVVDERTGRVLYGAPFVKKVETGYEIRGAGQVALGRSTDEAMMATMQREVALAVARLVSFSIEPVRVEDVDGYDIRLNYGAPLIGVGDTVMVQGSDRMRPLRYKVVSAGAQGAIAEVDGDNSPDQVFPGALVDFVEADDPQAQGRRYRKSRLP